MKSYFTKFDLFDNTIDPDNDQNSPSQTVISIILQTLGKTTPHSFQKVIGNLPDDERNAMHCVHFW